MTEETKAPDGASSGVSDSTQLLCCVVDKDAEPMADIGICSSCGWRGPVDKCELGKEGSWEEGYFDFPLCPVCDDGGCIDDYAMSDEREEEWQKWHENKQHNAGIQPDELSEDRLE